MAFTLDCAVVGSLFASALHSFFWLSGALPSIGLHSSIVNSIESFLNGRSLSVCLDGFKSAVQPINAGVPQGPVLAPTLLSILMIFYPSRNLASTRILTTLHCIELYLVKDLEFPRGVGRPLLLMIIFHLLCHGANPTISISMLLRLI